MEAIYFLTFWVGGALLHTLYELKVKPYLEGTRPSAGVKTGEVLKRSNTATSLGGMVKVHLKNIHARFK